MSPVKCVNGFSVALVVVEPVGLCDNALSVIHMATGGSFTLPPGALAPGLGWPPF
jgi:hypothetical protein